MLESKGIAGKKDWGKMLPDESRRRQGPYVVFECFQEIPCNPCEKACPRGAVGVGKDINAIPVIDYDLCNGCALCVPHCPGVAIFVVDETYMPGYGKVMLPWEYLPVPEKGEVVTGLARDGTPVCQAEVVEVRRAKAQDRTAVVGLKVPLEHVNEVRGLKMEGQQHGK